MKTPEGISGENNQEGSKVEASPISASDYSKMVQDYHSITIRSVVSDPYSMYLKRNKAVEIFTAGTGEVAKGLVAMNTSFKEKSNGETGLAAAKDPALVMIAADNCKLQEAALNPETPPSSIIIPEAYKARGEAGKTLQERTRDSLHTFDKQGIPEADNKYILDVKGASSSVEDKKVSPENSDNDVDTSYVDMALGNNSKGGSVELKNSNEIDFTEEDTSKYKIIKQGELNNSPVSFDPSENKVALEVSLPEVPYDAVETSNVLQGKDIYGRTEPTFEKQDNPPVYPSSIDIEVGVGDNDEVMNSVHVNNFTPEEQVAAKEKWYRENAGEAAIEDAEKEARIRAREQLAALTKESQERVEKLNAALDARNNKSKANLEKMGLGGFLARGLEAWGKADPKLRYALAIALAGASIATGTVLFGALGKVLSAGTFAANDFAEKMKEAKEQGKDMKVGWQAVKSLIKGGAFALGTSAAFSLAGDAIDGVKHYFETSGAAIPDAAPRVAVGLPIDAADLAPNVDTLAPLGEYTIQSGYNFTKIALEKVMPHISGFDTLTDLQKNNMVENMFTLAKDNPDNPLFDSLRQYFQENADAFGGDHFHTIPEGGKVDLAKLKEIMTEFRSPNILNSEGIPETLFEHAMKLKS